MELLGDPRASCDPREIACETPRQQIRRKASMAIDGDGRPRATSLSDAAA
jgi:hypothetical protein